MNNTDKLDLTTPDLVHQNIDKIATLFPNCITETAEGKAVDFDLLKQELNHQVVEGAKERYRLEWPGKKEAIVTANLPTTKTLRPVPEDSMHKDGTPFKKGEKFYASPLGKMDGDTENLYIEGDNLEVLKILQESYLGKIKMIYIDPPYNTGNDFVYKDNFIQDSTAFKEESGQIDQYGNRLVANPETAGRYHSDWLSMMYPRLKLARNLLTEDGVIFISIGPDEISNLTNLCDEIFGEVSRAAILVRQAKTGGNTGKFFSPNVEYILVYLKKIEKASAFKSKMDENLIRKVYNQIEESGDRKGEKYRTMGLYQASLKDLRPNQKYFIDCPDGSKVLPPCKIQDETMRIGDGRWRWTKGKFLDELAKGNVVFKESKNEVLVDSNGSPSKWNIYTKIWLKDREEEGQVPNDLILKYENRHSSKELKELDIPFDFAKPVGLIQYLIEITPFKDGDIILDYFSGSASTVHAVMQLNAENGDNLKYIMAQLPELTDEKSKAKSDGYKNICEIGKERIRRAGQKIVKELEATIGKKKQQLEKLANSALLIKDEQKIETLKTEIANLQTKIDNLDTGFKVFKVDTSNMQDVFYKPQDYKQGQLDVFADNIKEDRSTEDLLTQVLLDWGLSLTLKTEILNIQGKEVFKIAENSLMACFSTGVDEAFAKEVATHQPLRIVFKDSAFKDDTAKENVKQLLKQLSPNTEMKVI